MIATRILTLFGLLIHAGFALGQSDVPEWRRVALAPDILLPDAPQAASRTSTGTHRQPDFFVIDSAKCPQSPGHCLPKCQHRVSRFLPDKRYHPSSRNELITSLQPGVPVCIVVHGSFVGAGSLYPETIDWYSRMLASSNDQPLHFIGLHWPSFTGLVLLPALQINALGRRAEYNGYYLAQFMNEIPADHPVCLIGHSHGCRVISSALHLLGGGTVRKLSVQNVYPQRRIRVVFGAAAVDHHWLNPGERYGNALTCVESLLNIQNQQDGALALYPLREPHLDHAAGQVGFLERDLQAMGAHRSKIRRLEVSHLVGLGHAIEWYARHPQIQSAYLPYVYFD